MYSLLQQPKNLLTRALPKDSPDKIKSPSVQLNSQLSNSLVQNLPTLNNAQHWKSDVSNSHVTKSKRKWYTHY